MLLAITFAPVWPRTPNISNAADREQPESLLEQNNAVELLEQVELS